MTNEEFIMEVLRLTSFDLCEAIWWRTDTEYAPLTIFVNCSDLFWWASVDSERLTPENIDVFRRSIEDMREIGEVHLGPLLFCARVRGMRPQGAYYEHFTRKAHELFNAAGPERETGLGNPKPNTLARGETK
jgi:hypothetical protein